LAAKRPVLAVGPTDGDVADVLNQSQAGFMVDFDDFAATKQAILTYYQKFQKSALIVNSTSIEKYSRKELTGQLVKVLDSE
jgi:malate synthase